MAYAMLGLLALLSLIPAPDMGGGDKLLHVVGYAGLCAAFVVLVQQPRNLWRLAIALILYGVLLEFAQGMTTYRTLDGWDMLANTVGVCCGLLIRLTPLPETLRWLETQWMPRD